MSQFLPGPLATLYSQASTDPTLALALGLFFLLTASMAGGIGRLVLFAVISLRMVRSAAVIGAFTALGFHFL